MKERRTDLLLSWPFLASLVILSANDWYLKPLYNNWVTGKLSDFSGLLLCCLFLFALFPRRVGLSSWSIAAGFAWWKSPLAQPLIDLVQAAGLTSFDRVVDYSDLLALTMIPVAVALFSRPSLPRIPSSIHDEWLRKVLFGLSFFAITGTSMVPHHESYYLRKAEGTGRFETNTVTTVLAKVADKHFLVPYPNNNNVRGGFYGAVDMRYRVSQQETAVKLELVGTDAEKIRQLSAELKQAFGISFDNMELVILLPERHEMHCRHWVREQRDPGALSELLPGIDFDLSKAGLIELLTRHHPGERFYIFDDVIEWRRFEFHLDAGGIKQIVACEV